MVLLVDGFQSESPNRCGRVVDEHLESPMEKRLGRGLGLRVLGEGP